MAPHPGLSKAVTEPTAVGELVAAPAAVDPASPAGSIPAEGPPTVSPAGAAPKAAAAPRPGPDAAEAGRVAAYFAQLERIQAGGSGSSEEAAQRMLAALLQGDASAFDRLLADAEQAERAARQVNPPPECADHHAGLLQLLAESREVLQALRAAIDGEDSASLIATAARATALQQRAERLQALETEIKRRRGQVL